MGHFCTDFSVSENVFFLKKIIYQACQISTKCNGRYLNFKTENT